MAKIKTRKKGTQKTAARNKAKLAPPLHFKTLPLAEVPLRREGKHHAVLAAVFSDLEKLYPGTAIRIPLAELKESKANFRSALSRAAQKLKFRVATSSDGDDLFVWRTAD